MPKLFRLFLHQILVMSLIVAGPVALAASAKRVKKRSLASDGPASAPKVDTSKFSGIGYTKTPGMIDFWESVGLRSNEANRAMNSSQIQNHISTNGGKPGALTGDGSTAFHKGQYQTTSGLRNSLSGLAIIEADLRRASTLIHQANPQSNILMEQARATTKALSEERHRFSGDVRTMEIEKKQLEVRVLERSVEAHRNMKVVVDGIPTTLGQAAVSVYNRAVETLTNESNRLAYKKIAGYDKVSEQARRAKSKMINSSAMNKSAEFKKWFEENRPSKWINKSTTGAMFRITLPVAGIMAAMTASGYAQLLWDHHTKGFQTDPSAVERAFEDNVNMMTITSISTLFASGFYGHHLIDRAGEYRKKVLMLKQSANRAKVTGLTKAEKKFRRTVLGGMTWDGIKLGAAGSILVGGYMGWLTDCKRLFDNQPLNEAPMAPSERSRLAQQCDDGFGAYMWEQRHQFLQQTALMFAAIYAMDKGSTQLTRWVKPENSKTKTKAGVQKGLPKNASKIKKAALYLAVNGFRFAVSIVSFGIGFVIFSAVSFILGKILQFFLHRIGVVGRVTRNKKFLDSQLSELREKDWKLMDVRGTASKEQWEKQKKLWNQSVAEMRAFGDSMSGLRDVNTGKIFAAVDAWTLHYGRASNIYAAARLFYADIAEQVGQRRSYSATKTQSLQATSFDDPNHDGIRYHFSNILRHQNEKLPLFRSSPYFSMDPTIEFDRPHVKHKWTFAPSFSNLDFDGAPGDAFNLEEISQFRKTAFHRMRTTFISWFDAYKDKMKDGWKRWIEASMDLVQAKTEAEQLLGMYKISQFLTSNTGLIKHCSQFDVQSHQIDDSSTSPDETIDMSLFDGFLKSRDFAAPYAAQTPYKARVWKKEEAQIEIDEVPYAHQTPFKSKVWMKGQAEGSSTHEPADGSVVTSSKPALCHLYGLISGAVVEKPLGNLQVPFRSGVAFSNRNSHISGFMPASMGAEFIHLYQDRMNANDIDPLWYHDKLYGVEFNSMTHELLVSMFCGPSADQAYIDSSRGWDKDFHPPRLPLSSGRDLCKVVRKTPADDLLLRITDSDGKQYHGIVDLIYQELDSQLASEAAMQRWFDNSVAPALEAEISEGAAEFHEKIVLEHFRQALNEKDRTWDYGKMNWLTLTPKRHGGTLFGGSEAKGTVTNLFEELNFYFDKLINPLVEDYGFTKAVPDEGLTIRNLDTNAVIMRTNVNWIDDTYGETLEPIRELVLVDEQGEVVAVVSTMEEAFNEAVKRNQLTPQEVFEVKEEMVMLQDVVKHDCKDEKHYPDYKKSEVITEEMLDQFVEHAECQGLEVVPRTRISPESIFRQVRNVVLAQERSFSHAAEMSWLEYVAHTLFIRASLIVLRQMLGIYGDQEPYVIVDGEGVATIDDVIGLAEQREIGNDHPGLDNFPVLESLREMRERVAKDPYAGGEAFNFRQEAKIPRGVHDLMELIEEIKAEMDRAEHPAVKQQFRMAIERCFSYISLLEASGVFHVNAPKQRFKMKNGDINQVHVGIDLAGVALDKIEVQYSNLLKIYMTMKGLDKVVSQVSN